MNFAVLICSVCVCDSSHRGYQDREQGVLFCILYNEGIGSYVWIKVEEEKQYTVEKEKSIY